MNKLMLLFALLCLVVVSARHHGQRRDEDLEDKEQIPTRHRRRRWQMNYGYDYPAPPNYYPERKDNHPNQEIIQNIFRLLQDISHQLKNQNQRPQLPPPQPIYIPYPVPYPTSAKPPCTPLPTTLVNNENTGTGDLKPTSGTPNITSRFPAMEDTNQNWGFVVSEENEEDSSDGSRPISFQPIIPKQMQKRPPPEVDHNRHTLNIPAAPTLHIQNERARTSTLPIQKMPGMCNAAVLSCCGFSSDIRQQKQCFTSIGCSMANGIASPCSPETVQMALDSFKMAYSPLT